MKRVALSCFGIACISLGLSFSASAQGMIGIIPLKSTCEDVKRILKVEKCSFPQSTFLLSDFWITINFVSEPAAGKSLSCYRVPVGKVKSFDIAYKKPFPLKDFPYELTYVEGPFGDIDTIGYENKERGIQVLVNNGKVNTVFVAPSPEQRKKFAYNCPKQGGTKRQSGNR